MITAIYHIMINFVNKLFKNLDQNHWEDITILYQKLMSLKKDIKNFK